MMNLGMGGRMGADGSGLGGGFGNQGLNNN